MMFLHLSDFRRETIESRTCYEIAAVNSVAAIAAGFGRGWNDGDGLSATTGYILTF